uniref:Uncharacterized protein n=1 Tax=Arundo donax TaxID=35708 RepID=A0A0A9DRZ6_ARUDO
MSAGSTARRAQSWTPTRPAPASRKTSAAASPAAQPPPATPSSQAAESAAARAPCARRRRTWASPGSAGSPWPP